MKESVRIKCSKKHNDEVGYFDLTPDMIIVNGNMVRARCPECNASVLLSWKNVADLLETTVEEAKVQLQNGTVPKIAVIPREISEPEVEMPTPAVASTPVNAYSQMLTSTEKPPAERVKVITKMEEPEPTTAENPTTIGDTMGGFSVSEVDKTTNEVLADVIRSQPGLNKTVVDEVIEYIALKPEGWPPNMVKMILEAYKVTPTVCDVIVARYGMKLNMIEQKRRGMDQLRGMLPNPNSTIPGYGNSNPGFSPGINPFNTPTPQNMGQQNLGVGPGNMGMAQVSTQQMWMAYQQDPNAFFAWLSSNPSYIPTWQQFFQQMQAMGMGMQRPMMPGMPGMMGMGMPTSGAGTSREDVRRMISAEMDQVKAAIQQIVAQNAPKPQQDDTVKTIILPMLLKMMDDKKTDNGPDFTQALLGKLLDKSLEDKGGEIQYVIQKMEEMEKRREEITRATEEARKQANPFSNVNSVDSLETALKLHEVLGNFDIKREELKDKVKQREMWSSVIGGGLDTLGKAFSTVMMVKQGQGGAMATPVEVPIESTANVSTAVCENCKTKITYAIGTPRVVCPGCNTVYDVVPSGQQAAQMPPQVPVYEQPEQLPPHVMVYDDTPEQLPEDHVEQESNNAVNITVDGSNQEVGNVPTPPPVAPQAPPKRSRKKDRQDGM
jgi:hypothetical protein